MGRPSWNSGVHGIYSQETLERMRAAKLHAIWPNRDTSIEKLLQSALRDREIVFVKQYPILNRTRADIAFPNQKLAVYCDGDYWHRLPQVRERDTVQEMILRANGWRVLRFWEHEINANAAGCADRVEKELVP